MRTFAAGWLLPAFVVLTLPAVGQKAEPSKRPFEYQEVMIPVRDGVHLQTVVLTPTGSNKPLPILFRRTPYGLPEQAPDEMPASWKELAREVR